MRGEERRGLPKFMFIGLLTFIGLLKLESRIGEPLSDVGTDLLVPTLETDGGGSSSKSCMSKSPEIARERLWRWDFAGGGRNSTGAASSTGAVNVRDSLMEVTV